MRLVPPGRITLAAGLVGASVALWLLLPLPPAGDVYAARRYGVGAGYVGFILGFPVGALGVPVSVLLHPFPVGNHTSGAGVVAVTMASIVGVNWACWAAALASLVRMIRQWRRQSVAPRSRPPA